MTDSIEDALKPSTPHELIVTFLQRECEMREADYDAFYVRVIEWAANYGSDRIAVNEFSPIMLLEQIRKEFDEGADFLTFALVASDLQWGPRMIKLGAFDKPVWVITLDGFPKMIDDARRMVVQRDAYGK